jgi:hypothetical protein
VRPALGGAGASVPFRLNDVRFTGSLDSTYSATLSVATATGGAERTHTAVSYDKRLYSQGSGLSFSTSYFGGDINRPGAGDTWPSFDSCFLRKTVGFNETICGGPVTNSYLIFDGTPDNPHFLQNNVGGSWTVTDNVFEAPQLNGTYTDAGDLVFGPAGPLSLKRNLVVPVSTGAFAGYAPGVLCSNGGFSSTVVTAEHNTCVGRMGSPHMYYGETYSGYAGIYGSVKSNLVANLSGTVGGTYAFGGYTNAVTQADGCLSANVTNNGKYGLATGSAGLGYNYPVSSGTPGASDVTGNPNFLAPTRNLATWGATQGADGSVAGALAVIAANPSLISQATTGLVPWVRAGFAPTNPAYHNAAHDGRISAPSLMCRPSSRSTPPARSRRSALS